MISKAEFTSEYSSFYAVSKLGVSSKDIMKRFNLFNRGKPYGKQIKPFNFFLIGVGNSREVKPISPFSKEPQEAVHKPFIDYKSGNILSGMEYWKSLSDVLLSYIDHGESKLDGNIGILERKHLNIDGFTYIGKEASNLERTGTVDSPEYAVYQDGKELAERIKSMSIDEARKLGMPKTTYYRLKRATKKGNSTKTSQKIMRCLLRF